MSIESGAAMEADFANLDDGQFDRSSEELLRRMMRNLLNETRALEPRLLILGIRALEPAWKELPTYTLAR